jgi:hypothetical protein
MQIALFFIYFWQLWKSGAKNIAFWLSSVPYLGKYYQNEETRSEKI